MSGGTEGVMTPHATIFTQGEVEAAGAGCSPGWLAIGISFTRDFLPEELGTIVQVEEVARAVEVAMARARIDSTEDVHFVQIKCPLLTSETIRDAVQRGKRLSWRTPINPWAFPEPLLPWALPWPWARLLPIS